MKIFLCVVLFLFVLTQSVVHSYVSQEKGPDKEGSLVTKRFVPQAERPGRKSRFDSLFDPQAERPGKPGKGGYIRGAQATKRLVPQAEHPNEKPLFDSLFDPQAERPGKGGKWEKGAKRLVPQDENPHESNTLDKLFDPQAEQDQDVCMWRCREWCQKRCKKSSNAEECLDGCYNYRGRLWRRCIRKCQNGDLDRPGGEGEEEEEEEEEEK